MDPASSPVDRPSTVADPLRLEALHETGLLDSGADPIFDRLTGLAARLLKAPTALFSLIDRDRELFKSAFGLAEPWASRRETPLSHGLSRHLVDGEAVFEVCDARVDPRLRDNLGVAELGIVAYLGVPLHGQRGDQLGALCAIDGQPRRWSPEELASLREVAAVVEAAIAERTLRRAAEGHARAVDLDLAASRRALLERTSWLEALLEAMDDSVVVLDASGNVILANEVGRQLIEDWPNARSWPAGSGFFMADQRTPYPIDLLPANQALKGIPVHQQDLFIRSPLAPDNGLWLSINATPLRDGPDRISGAVVVSRDTTTLREASLEILKNNRDRGLLHQVAAAANQFGDVERVLHEALAAILERTGWPLGHVYLRRGDRTISSPIWVGPQRESYGALVAATMAIPPEHDLRIIGEVIRSGRMRFVENLAAEADPLRAPTLQASGLASGVFLPIQVDDQPIAVVELFLPRDVPAPDAEFLLVLGDAISTLGRVFERAQTRVALERHSEQLQALSLIDDLTGLYNRRGFLTLAEQQRRAGQRARLFHHLIFVDLDGMKGINDQLGHAQGDVALQDTARLLRSVFRESDILARLGGDEFVVFAASGTADGDRPILARVREALRQYNEAASRPFKLEMSIGATACDPEHPRPIDELLRVADGLMYEQKRQRKAQGVSRSPPDK